jgi:hypothetical protein
MNYLSALDINSFYFLTKNVAGNGKNAWPFIDRVSLYIYDVSKLA